MALYDPHERTMEPPSTLLYLSAISCYIAGVTGNLIFWSVWMCKFFGFLTEPDTAGALRSILMALVDPLKFASVE